MTARDQEDPRDPPIPARTGRQESELFAVVETANGRLRGLISGGIRVFKGVRYAADTSGANRFLPPVPVPRWAGIRDATDYGNYAPQVPADRRRAYSDLILSDLRPGGMGEDCLALNIWTPTTASNAGCPVLVHLHGGGYYSGSGNSPQFDGEMLARFGNAVVVSVNHRIGALGFLNLGGVGGERHAQSGANGMLDIVAALAWVRENIVAFGGDPSKVLVFGQSGGGLKTSVLLAMPGARGLFQRAGVMSGSELRVATMEDSMRTTDSFLALLGIGRGNLRRLHELPFHTLLAAQALLEEEDRRRGEPPRAFGPVVDGTAIPRHPFDPDAPALSRDVPLVVGTVLDERSYRLTNFDLDECGLLAYAERVVGAQAREMVAMYREEDRHASPYLLQVRIDSDLSFRKAAHLQAERKARLGGAPTFAYLWRAPSPAYGTRYGAVHGVDIGPSMYDIRHGLNGPSDTFARLAGQIAGAWVAFADSGDPNNAGTPAWPAYDEVRRQTMVFDAAEASTKAQDDPRRDFRLYWAAR